MRLATLLVRCEDNWISSFSNRTGMSVQVQRCALKSGGRGRSILRISGPEGRSKEEVEGDIGISSPSCSVSLTTVSPGKWIGTAEVTDCRLCCALSNSDCMLDSARSNAQGEVEWVVVAPNASALSSLVGELRALGCQVDVAKVKDLKDARELTEHQRKALRLAYELGYYDIPKRINLQELARRMEISKPTLDIILRRAQRKLVEERMESL